MTILDHLGKFEEKLNIKGQPIVNDRADGVAFTNKYKVKVLG